VGVDMAYSPSPTPSPTRGEGDNCDYFLTKRFTKKKLQAGEVVFSQGEPATFMRKIC